MPFWIFEGLGRGAWFKVFRSGELSCEGEVLDRFVNVIFGYGGHVMTVGGAERRGKGGGWVKVGWRKGGGFR